MLRMQNNEQRMQMNGQEKTNCNPDVLSCIANLSSDEVFTPPQLVNQMLDMLPREIWSDTNARFLDPGCKSGVFLREIAKRLDTGWKIISVTGRRDSTTYSRINCSG